MRSFEAAFAFASACSLALGFGCAAKIQRIHSPPTLAEIREINAEAPVSVVPLPACRCGDAWKVDHVVSADAEKIVVAPDHLPPFAFPLGDVAWFHARRTGRGALIGAGVGAGIGAVGGLFTAFFIRGTGYRSADAPPDTSGSPVGPVLKVAAIFALGYSMVGAVIGAIAGSPEDFPLTLGPAPPSSYRSPTPAAELALAPPSPPAAKRAAIVVAPSAEVRSAPFKVAPVIVTLARGQHLDVDPTPNAGWRVAYLSDGRVGYIQDAQVEMGSP